MTAEDVLHRHAKDLRRHYDRDARETENAAVFRRHAAVIHETVDWLAPACADLDIERHLRNAAL